MLQLDHVTFAAWSLERLTRPLERIGLAPGYGGAHANNVTHMSMLGFADGSYLEFIAPIKDLPDNVIWRSFMAGDAGPAAWCVRRSSPLAADVARLRALGVEVQDPVVRARQRPDGVTLEWELAFIGSGSPGSLHPLLIHDHTARALRVQVSISAARAGLVGIEAVILLSANARSDADALMRAYGLPAPLAMRIPSIDARLLHFPGEHLILAEPDDRAIELEQRCARFGTAPLAVLLGARDVGETSLALGFADQARATNWPLWITDTVGSIAPFASLGIVATGSIVASLG